MDAIARLRIVVLVAFLRVAACQEYYKQAWSDVPADKYDGGSFKASNIDNFPGSSSMSASLVCLEAGAIRNWHWHNEAEWAIVLSGACRATVLEEGPLHSAETWDFFEGDVWYFRPNEGHNTQGLGPMGCCYLAGYNSGTFFDPASPNFAAWLSVLPGDVVTQGLGEDLLQNHRKYSEGPQGFISLAPIPQTSSDEYIGSMLQTGPQQAVKFSHRYQLMRQKPKAQSEGGFVIVGDVTKFPVSTDMSGAFVKLSPGGMRQLHWHVNFDEWQFVINGTIKAGVTNTSGHYEETILHGGDAGFAPRSSGHYFKNIGDTDCYMVLIFNAGVFTNIDISGMTGNTSPEVLEADLSTPEDLVKKIDTTIPTIVAPLKTTYVPTCDINK